MTCDKKRAKDREAVLVNNLRALRRLKKKKEGGYRKDKKVEGPFTRQYSFEF